MDLIFFLLNIGKEHFTDSVLIICVVALFGYQIYQAHKTDKNSEEIKEACSLQFAKEKLSKQLVSIVKTSVSINKQLDCLIYNLCADRAQLYLFHNSGHDLLGQPFAKITNTNESATPGISPLIESRKDLPVGLLAYFVDNLLTNGEAKYCDIENLKDDGLKRYFQAMNIKSSYAVAIFAPKEGEGFDTLRSSRGSIPLGFVCVDYVRKQKTLSNEEWQKLHDIAMIIKGEVVTRRSGIVNDRSQTNNLNRRSQS